MYSQEPQRYIEALLCWQELDILGVLLHRIDSLARALCIQVLYVAPEIGADVNVGTSALLASREPE